MVPLSKQAIADLERAGKLWGTDGLVFPSVRDSVRAKMRNMIRRLLKKYKYPPDKRDDAIDLILKQAEALSHEWTAR